MAGVDDDGLAVDMLMRFSLITSQATARQGHTQTGLFSLT
jgi:hypothetical protein